MCSNLLQIEEALSSVTEMPLLGAEPVLDWTLDPAVFDAAYARLRPESVIQFDNARAGKPAISHGHIVRDCFVELLMFIAVTLLGKAESVKTVPALATIMTALFSQYPDLEVFRPVNITNYATTTLRQGIVKHQAVLLAQMTDSERTSFSSYFHFRGHRAAPSNNPSADISSVEEKAKFLQSLTKIWNTPGMKLSVSQLLEVFGRGRTRTQVAHFHTAVLREPAVAAQYGITEDSIFRINRKRKGVNSKAPGAKRQCTK